MSSMQRRFIRAALVCAGSISLFGPAFTVAAEAAAASDSGDQLETVIVTGSRIARRDYEANSPILTVDESLLKNSSTAAIETNLTKLPQFHPVQTPTMGGDIQPTATNTPGAATVSLRGLGANRNLVLLDGRRATPGNASMVVDINTIPSLAIERVETITGGASATYGADAVGGVVNFIMKRNFQGLQFDAQLGETAHNDGFEYQVGGIMGSNLADDRGNVTFAFALNQRQGAKRIDRSWFRDAMLDPTIGGDEFFPDFSGFDPLFGNAPSQASYDTIFGAGAVAAGTRLYFNPDGTAFTGFFQSFAPGGASRFQGDLTGTKWKQTTDGLLAQNYQNALLIIPLKRSNFYTDGHYEINDWLGFFAAGLFSKVETRTVQQPSPSVNGWAAFVPHDAAHPVPAELESILNSRPDPTAPWRLTYYLNYADRALRADVFTYNMQAGFNGKIPGTDWTWEVYGAKGESETTALTTGVASLARFRAIIEAPNYGAGFVGNSNPAFGGFGANFATCTSGISPFVGDPSNKAATLSADCIQAISSNLKTRATLQQDIWEANAQGKLFELPAGDMRAAIGASYRQNRYEFLNDTLTSQGVEFNDQAIGIYPSGDAGGQITVKEIYGELLVPLLKDLPLVKKLELELGIRSSHYDTTGSSTTYKALADWRPNDWLRFRGGYNRAERSPNIGELYLAPSQTFQIGAAGDLCSFANPLSVSANPANWGNSTDPLVNKALGLCRALMERAAPGTADTFYANPQYAQSQPPTFAFPSVRGNPTLKPEEAKTWTFGAVIDSPWDGAYTRGLRLSVDYYNIKVDDAIGPQSVDVAQRQCFDPAFNPNYDVNSPYCLGIGRVANDGALGDIRLTYYNNGRFETSGIDTQIDWAFDLGPGRFSLNSVIGYLISLKSAELSVDPLVEFAGSLGPTQNELNAGSFKWKMYNTFGYGIGKWNAAIQWQHLPSVKSAAYASNHATFIQGAGSYDLFGLSGTYAVMKDTVVRIGVENLLDKAPPLLNRNTDPGLPGFLLRGGNFGGTDSSNPALYDFIGRRFYIGATMKL
ncbi:MAG: TonB-dependent receptor [Gammaproteobacteria bacterium]|nr:TonB-dependent receptor [Gammaproteobacteria bacterium]